MVRRLSLLALVMLLGALTTIATAWGLAAWAPFSDAGPRVSGAFVQWGEPWHITRMRRFGGGVRLHWWSNLTGDEPIRTPADLLRAVTRRSTPDELVASSRTRLTELERTGATRYPIKVDNAVPMWGTFTGDALPQAARIGSDTAFGWPAPCLSYQVVAGFNRVTMSPISDQLQGGLMLSGSPSCRVNAFRALPLRPIWWGLVINTLVFSALWGLLLVGPARARRLIRRRRGRCTRCGYDLSGQAAPGCPECGAGRL